MRILDTPLSDLKIIEPDVFADSRGYFFECYNMQKYKDTGVDCGFVQDNESLSSKGVVRGLHYQLAPFSQTKLVRVVKGNVFDVAVDLRKGSPSFGKWFGIELSGENKLQLLIPVGFAHGFSVLSTTVIFVYKCDQVYNKQAERCIRYDDPFLGIEWRVPEDEQVVSEKDRHSPFFANAEMNFEYSK
jgi:dTDP-4-dehydrorhamnose 3,5-epimerase